MKFQARSFPKRKLVDPPVYLLGTMILLVCIHFVFSGCKLIPTPWSLFGIVPLCVGVFISTFAERQFHKANTTVKPFKKSTTLVTEGLFRFSRNPIYLGFVLVLIGIWILLGSLIPFIVILCFIYIIHVQFINVEEQMLAINFGTEWQKYQKRVRRWL